MKVLLFQPKIGIPEKWFKMPLNLMVLASVLEDAGHSVQIIDGHLRDLRPEDLKGVGVVGIGTMTGHQIKHALEAAQLVRDTDPTIQIVWGGWHVTALPAQTLLHTLVDYVVTGPGEYALLELIEELEKGIRPQRILNGLVAKYNPAYHLINVEDYIGPDLGTRTLSYCSSIGCPGRCYFCVISGPWHGIDAEKLVGDVRHLVQCYGINAIRFDDGNFFASKSRVEKFCDGLKYLGIKIQWSAFGRADQLAKVDESFFQMIAESGCTEIAVGAESSVPRVLELINKGATVDDFFQAMERCEKYGITMLASWVVGFPGEANDEIRTTMDTIRLLRHRRPEQMLYFYNPWPGTAMWEKSVQNGLKVPMHLEEWTDWRLEECNLPWLGEAIKREISTLAKELRTERFYLRAARVSKQMKGLVGKLLNHFASWRVDHLFFPFEMWLFLLLQGRGKFLSRIVAKREKR